MKLAVNAFARADDFEPGAAPPVRPNIIRSGLEHEEAMLHAEIGASAGAAKGEVGDLLGDDDSDRRGVKEDPCNLLDNGEDTACRWVAAIACRPS